MWHFSAPRLPPAHATATTTAHPTGPCDAPIYAWIPVPSPPHLTHTRPIPPPPPLQAQLEANGAYAPEEEDEDDLDEEEMILYEAIKEKQGIARVKVRLI